MAELSKHILSREPSPIRRAQILYSQRVDSADMQVINVSIGNISLPMHPAMLARMGNLFETGSPFANNQVKYPPSVGFDETRQAFKHLIGLTGAKTERLHVTVTDGGSMAMELMVLATCGPGSKRPLAVIDPSYSNYISMAGRAGVPVVSLPRTLEDDQKFSLPDLNILDTFFKKHRPAALVVIPADNPTGQALDLEALKQIAEACVKHGVWMVSDEAYRGLNYETEPVSLWQLSDADVPGIEGARISIESSSKMFNACGLRVGALITDHPELGGRVVNELTANLSGNAIGQYIFGSLLHESYDDLRPWYAKQRQYYKTLMAEVTSGLRETLPSILVSQPQGSLYSVLDVRNIVGAHFDAQSFVEYCATEGRVEIDGEALTLLASPMGGFYADAESRPAGRTQMRIAYVEPAERMKQVPALLKGLLEAYCAQL